MMRKSLMAALVVPGLLQAGVAAAVTWTPPNNVRIVQKSGPTSTNVLVSGGTIDTQIQAAITQVGPVCFPNAPCVVKVMPGVYDLGTASLRMRPNVDLVGAGPDDTIITSSNANVDGSACTVGTVIMAADSTIRNVKLVNRAPDLGGNYIAVAALVFDGVKARAQGIQIETGSNLAPGGQNNGACTNGPLADALLNDVDVVVHNGMGQSNAVMTFGGRLTVTNSRLAVTHGPEEDSCHVLNDNSPWEAPTTVDILNTTLQASCSNSQGIFAGANDLRVTNSVVTLKGVSWEAAFWAEGPVEVVNTKFVGTGALQYYAGGPGDPNRVRIANSLLAGDRSGLTTAEARLVGNYDEHFVPIPNSVPPQ